MVKYYTRACNFYYGPISLEKVKNKQSIPLHGNKLISFDTVEILTRTGAKRINIKEISKIGSKIRKKIIFDIKKISQKKKN